MVLTSYFDESGTHGDSVVTTMGGVLGTTRQFELFERKFKALQRRFGFKVFHTKKFKHGTGEFKGWSRRQKIELLDALAEISNRAFLDAVTFSLDNADYEAVMRRTPDFPKKARIPTKYGLAFLECLKHFAVYAENHPVGGKHPKIAVVCEAGAKNVGDAERIFYEHKQLAEIAGAPLFVDINFADKSSNPALMIADFFAHTRYLRESEGIPVRADEILPEGSRDLAVTALTYPRGALAEAHQQIISEHQRRVQRAAGRKAPSTRRSS